MLSGVIRYIDTPYSRTLPEAPVVWRRGAARLLDYGQLGGQDIENPSYSGKTVVLFVPSLINRYYILDLEEKCSFLRHLVSQGLYPLVLDWGTPSAAENGFDCADYVTKILAPAIDFIAEISGQPISLAGYCMGGVLACAAAKLRRRKISSLALLAAPWDFHAPEFASFVLEKNWQAEVEKHIAGRETLSADVILSLFYLADPFIFEQKFRRFYGLNPNSEAARNFVSLERWVNDGVPMTAQVARDCLIGWAQENLLANGEWRVAGKKITPPPASLPTFIAIPKKDSVVPPSCAAPLARVTKHAHVVRPSAGHVGMIVGGRAKQELWLPYSNWLQTIDCN